MESSRGLGGSQYCSQILQCTFQHYIGLWLGEVMSYVTSLSFSYLMCKLGKIMVIYAPQRPFRCCWWLFVWDMILYNAGYPQIQQIADDELELLILLSPSSKFWDGRPIPSCLFHVMLGIGSTISCILGQQSTNWTVPLASQDIFVTNEVKLLLVTVYCPRGMRAWKNGAHKWAGLKSHQ